LLLRISTVRAPDGSMSIEAVHENRRKADKKARTSGRPQRLGRPREKLPKAGDVKNDVAGL
jgi:hypothetical protein